MAMTTAGKVAFILTVIQTIIGMCLALFGPDANFPPIIFGIFEAACVLAVGAMGLGGIGCKNRCLMMTFIVFAIIGIVIYSLWGITLIYAQAQYDPERVYDYHLSGVQNRELFLERKHKQKIRAIAYLVGLFINQILTGVAVFFYFKARREITAEMYNEFYAQNPVVTPVYSGYPQYGCQSPVYPGQAYPAPYYYQ